MRPSGSWLGGLRKVEGRVELGKEEDMILTGLFPRLQGVSVLSTVGAVHQEETKSLL